MRQRAGPSPSGRKAEQQHHPRNRRVSTGNVGLVHNSTTTTPTRRGLTPPENTSSWEITTATTDNVALSIEEDHEEVEASPGNNSNNNGGLSLHEQQYYRTSSTQTHLNYPQHHPINSNRTPISSGASTYQRQRSFDNTATLHATVMTPISLTEEKLRRFDQQASNQGRRLLSPQSPDFYNKSPASSVLLGSWQFQPRLEDYHTVFRTPLHVPDSQYGAYLLGVDNSRRRNGAPVLTRSCCAGTCAGFSAVGACFLLWVGIMLDTQPLYLPGTLPELVTQSTVTVKANGEVRTYNKPVIQYLVPGPTDERLPTATTAYKAAAAYFVTMLISLYLLDPSNFEFFSRLARRVFSRFGGNSHSSYDDIPDSDTGLPLAFNRSFSGEMEGSQRRASYQPGLWNRMTGAVKRWLALRGWYKPRKRRYGMTKKV
jgi:hypothetical protein